MRRILAQARKELTQIMRDRLALALALLLPLILLILLGTAISLTVTNMSIVVQDLDDSLASHDFTRCVPRVDTFHVVAWPVDRQPEQALIEGRARAAVIIPEHFGRDLARGVNANVQLLVDGTDSNTAKLLQGYAGQIVRAYRSSNLRGNACRSGHCRSPALVQPRPRLEEVLRPRHFRAGPFDVPAAAGRARHVEGRRRKDNSAGLRFKHFGP